MKSSKTEKAQSDVLVEIATGPEGTLGVIQM